MLIVIMLFICAFVFFAGVWMLATIENKKAEGMRAALVQQREFLTDLVKILDFQEAQTQKAADFIREELGERISVINNAIRHDVGYRTLVDTLRMRKALSDILKVKLYFVKEDELIKIIARRGLGG
jgi:hypothetical protein